MRIRYLERYKLSLQRILRLRHYLLVTHKRSPEMRLATPIQQRNRGLFSFVELKHQGGCRFALWTPQGTIPHQGTQLDRQRRIKIDILRLHNLPGIGNQPFPGRKRSLLKKRLFFPNRLHALRHPASSQSMFLLQQFFQQTNSVFNILHTANSYCGMQIPHGNAKHARGNATL